MIGVPGAGSSGVSLCYDARSPMEKRAAFTARNPATGALLDGEFFEATVGEIDRAARRAEFLRAIAQQILALGDRLLERTAAETAFPTARLESERARTVSQILLFAE